MTQPKDASSLIGTTLGGRYRILELLGVGAMGAVYVGEHVKIGRRDAIKVLRDSLATDREATLRFLRGARNVSAIRHPNVCTIYDFSDTADGLQFMAMELVQGETLKDTLDREGRLPLERAVHIAVQTAEALQAAHDAGIVHRDLKPGNIMLGRARDGRDQVKVVDFDIAKGSEEGGEEVTRHGFVVGTPEYMSPEQLMGEPLDGRSDIYSLALVLFRMLAGGLPFQAASTQDVMIQRLTHRPLRLDELARDLHFPERLQHAIGRALERRASDRWANAAEFGHELQAAIASPDAAWSAPAVPPSAIPPTRSGPTPAELPPELLPTRIGPAAKPQEPAPTVVAPAARSKRWPVVAIGSVALVAVLGFVVSQLTGGGTSETGDGTPATQTQPGGDASLAQNPQSGNVGGNAAIDSGTSSDGGRGTSPLTPPSSPTGNDRRGQPDREPPAQPPPANSGGNTTSPGAPAVVIPPDRIDEVLDDALDRFPLEGGAPPPEVLRGVMDTALAVWVMRTERPASDRALAAYILATGHATQRAWRLCEQWGDSALILQPQSRGYLDLRDRCRDQRD